MTTIRLIEDVTEFKVGADLLEEKGFLRGAILLRGVKPEVLLETTISNSFGPMAQLVGLFQCLWYPKELKISTVSKLIPYLERGLTKMKRNEKKLRRLNSTSPGDYNTLHRAVSKLLEKCKDNLTAGVEVLP